MAAVERGVGNPGDAGRQAMGAAIGELAREADDEVVGAIADALVAQGAARAGGAAAADHAALRDDFHQRPFLRRARVVGPAHRDLVLERIEAADVLLAREVRRGMPRPRRRAGGRKPGKRRRLSPRDRVGTATGGGIHAAHQVQEGRVAVRRRPGDLAAVAVGIEAGIRTTAFGGAAAQEVFERGNAGAAHVVIAGEVMVRIEQPVRPEPAGAQRLRQRRDIPGIRRQPGLRTQEAQVHQRMRVAPFAPSGRQEVQVGIHAGRGHVRIGFKVIRRVEIVRQARPRRGLALEVGAAHPRGRRPQAAEGREHGLGVVQGRTGDQARRRAVARQEPGLESADEPEHGQLRLRARMCRPRWPSSLVGSTSIWPAETVATAANTWLRS